MLKWQSIFAAVVVVSTMALGIPLRGQDGSFLEGSSAKAAETKVAFSTITSDQLAEKLTRKDFLFVNVHIPYEGEIEQTDMFIPFDKIAENLDKLPSDRNAAIILYCRSGRMSEIAAHELAARGFTQISHLSGGMVDWVTSGRKIARVDGH
jgi:rhodanese-related sulfurtransferase